MATKTLLDARDCALTLNRLCCQLNEVHFPWNNSVIIGLQPRGTRLAEAIVERLQTEHGVGDVPFGALDITFHRDDFRRREEPLAASPNEMNVLIEGKRVILVDDVLYTGRSVRAGMDALQDYGRPLRVELCVLIDRRFSRELPIQPDYSGRRVDAIAEERVRLDWAEDLPSVLIESTPHAAQR
ncbi:MAG TPA: bifunctional pyr operon transcriptional regulator/uracil phosphoribosyltransferase PyrR [Cryomorphaceae bacterium]|nr:bifunctional pyr operon transcriptional regulator/uracil phosphoribosyltransferase PyrR [Cryomorphaceae bacterium]